MKYIKIITFILLIPSGFIVAQEGKIAYSFNYNLQKLKTYQSELTFTNTKSTFFWNDKAASNKLEKDDFGNISFHVESKDSIGQINITDFKKDSIVSRVLWIKNKVYTVQEKRKAIQWKLINEEKKIGNLVCKKAEGVFRGRTYIAWYTSDIPLPIGPWKLNGLPGAILEASDATKEVSFFANEISIPYKSENGEVVLDGETISLENFIKERKKLLGILIKTFKSKLPRGTNATLNSSKENYLEQLFEFEN